LNQKKSGAVLADDMGTGKTVQICAFLSGLFLSRQAFRALVVAPLSVIPNWTETMRDWVPSAKTLTFHASLSESEKRSAMNTVKSRVLARKGVVMVTTYGMVSHNPNSLVCDHNMVSWHDSTSRSDSDAPKWEKWDYVILDEGHLIKNPKAKISDAVRTLPTTYRVILSGTPVQNDLSELWSLMDFCVPKLLGSENDFKNIFSKSISQGNERGATGWERSKAQASANKLRKLIRPFFMRREKVRSKWKRVSCENMAFRFLDDVDPGENSQSEHEKLKGSNCSKQVNKLSVRKDELAVWCRMTSAQIKVYRKFLTSDSVAQVLNKTRNPLSAMKVLQDICNHTVLATDPRPELRSLRVLSPRMGSGKLCVLLDLLKHLAQTKHRTLVFSQSKRMLNVIQRELGNLGLKYLRIDGDMSNPNERKRKIDRFNRDEAIHIFLLTTKAGGLGITLTGADRVVLFDPSWNPSTDEQAVDRVYRIGQLRDCIIYRFITSGTIEEKIYCRQVFKKGLFRIATKNTSTETRYFSTTDLRNVFQLPATNELSKTCEFLCRLHGESKLLLPRFLKNHKTWMTKHSMVVGVSLHDLLFTIPSLEKKLGRANLFKKAQDNQKRDSRVRSERSVDIDLTESP